MNSAKVDDNSAQAEACSALVDESTKSFIYRYYKHFCNSSRTYTQSNCKKAYNVNPILPYGNNNSNPKLKYWYFMDKV